MEGASTLVQSEVECLSGRSCKLAGAKGEGLEAVENFVAIPAAAGSEDGAEGGKREVVEFLAVEIENLELGTGILFVLGEEFAAEDSGALQHGVVCGISSFQASRS